MSLLVERSAFPALDYEGRNAPPALLGVKIREIASLGWARVGVGAVIVTPNGEALMLQHRGRDKNSEGALGPLTETTHWAPTHKYSKETVVSRDGRMRLVEQPAATLMRSFKEELGVDLNSLGLEVPVNGGWFMHAVTEGTYVDRPILAICTALGIGETAAKSLVDKFEPTPEISRVGFIGLTAIEAYPNVRPGMGSLAAAAIERWSANSSERVPLALSPLPFLEGGADLELGDVSVEVAA